MKGRRRTLKSWTYEDEIYLLTTEDDRAAKADKLERSLPSISSKLGRLKKMNYTPEKLIRERQFIIDNHDIMAIRDMAKLFDISEATMNSKVEILRSQGFVGYKEKREEEIVVEEVRKQPIGVITKPHFPKNCIKKYDLYKLHFEPGDQIMSNNKRYRVVKDYGLFVLCTRNNVRECFNKVDFKIDKNTLEVM